MMHDTTQILLSTEKDTVEPRQEIARAFLSNRTHVLHHTFAEL